MGFLFWMMAIPLVTGVAHAASCPNLPPVEGNLGYRARSNPDRCEGIYHAPISGDLEFLSFTRGRVAFDSQTDRTVTIVAPDVAPLGATRVVVIAHALRPKVPYRMDTTLVSGGSWQWPLADVVIPASIASADLGLIGYPEGMSDIYVPLRISDEAIIAIFRSPKELEIFQWRLISGDSSPPAWRTLGAVGQVIQPGEKINLPLESVRTGQSTLDIAAKPISDEYIRVKYRIYVP
jgi:hypothetical protein